MPTKFKELLDDLPVLEKQLEPLVGQVLSNLIYINEKPAPTFNEDLRCEEFLRRLSDGDLMGNCSADDMMNAYGILPGSQGDRNILIVAHLDTVFNDDTDHSVRVQPGFAEGAGVGDDSLGLAAVASLPALLKDLDINLRSNLILMGSSRSLGRGNIEGLRFFLDNSDFNINAGVCLEGVKLGRLSYSSIGMLRGELIHIIPETYDWTRFGATGAVENMNEVIDKILGIPLPRQPRTTIVLGSLEAGTSFNMVATKAILRFEIRSESEEVVKDLEEQFNYIAQESAANTGAEVHFNVLARRKPGGIAFSHPLTNIAKEIIQRLDIKPRLSPSTSELSAFIDKDIPALTIGLTDGENHMQPNERVFLGPLTKGLAQLVSLIQAIDGGICDGN